MKTSSSIQQELGHERFKSDKRQLGGLMMLLGTAAMIFPMANLVSLVGPNGTTASEGIELSSLIASVVTITFGVVSVITGYMQAIHDVGHVYLTGFLLLWGQLAYLPFLTDLTAVGKGARSGAAFIPEAYEPSATDVRFVGAMGMLGILGYGTGFLGSLSLVQFALYAFQSGKPGARPGTYYAGRLTFYSFANLLVGLAQLLLGIYILATIGGGPFPDGPVVVAMFLVFFPEISIFVGLVQVLNASFGLARSFGFHRGETDYCFQVTTLFQWLCTLVFQILVQFAYAPSDTAASAAPSQTMITLGISVIVAYLDFKMCSTLDQLPADYYGLETHVDIAEPPKSVGIDEGSDIEEAPQD